MQYAPPISIWQKLRQKRSALISLYVIGFACLIAIFAYPLAPDNSPNADRRFAELGSRPPGFSKQFLLIPRRQVTHRPYLNRLFKGTPPSHDLLPINSFFFARDTIIVEHYIARGKQETLAFPLKNLQPPISVRQPLGQQQLWVYRHAISNHTFLLGTDNLGRDILSRLLLGTRISIGAGLIGTGLALVIALFLGLLAGYYRGWLDGAVMYLVNVLQAIPWLFLVFAITLSIGRGYWHILLAISLTMWVGMARLIREQVIALRQMGYIQSAHILGLPDMRIIVRHILPAMAGSLMVIAASNVAAAILIEAGLSFIGIGVQSPLPSLGLMIREHFSFLLANRPVQALSPGIVIVILAAAFYTLSSALRDVLEVREAEQLNRFNTVHNMLPGGMPEIGHSLFPIPQPIANT